MIILAFIFGVVITLFVLRVVTHCKDTRPKNNVRFYIARDKNKELWLYLGKPIREEESGYFLCKKNCSIVCHESNFEGLGLNTDNYKDFKWEDEPVEVLLNLED